MDSMRMTVAPKCLLAIGWTSFSTHSANVATMSQVSFAGGDTTTCGLFPTLISSTGAADPHAPALMGSAGTKTAATPRSRSAHIAFALVISSSDQTFGGGSGLLAAAVLPSASALVSGNVLGHEPGVAAGVCDATGFCSGLSIVARAGLRSGKGGGETVD